MSHINMQIPLGQRTSADEWVTSPLMNESRPHVSTSHASTQIPLEQMTSIYEWVMCTRMNESYQHANTFVTNDSYMWMSHVHEREWVMSTFRYHWDKWRLYMIESCPHIWIRHSNMHILMGQITSIYDWVMSRHMNEAFWHAYTDGTNDVYIWMSHVHTFE